MNWENIAGQEKIKRLLAESVENHRVSHAQLFVGKEGYGVLPLVLAYAKEIFKKENEKSAQKVEHLNHLDLHFSFPCYTVDKRALSKSFLNEFREKALENPYFDFDEWTEVLESNNKQLFISVHEIEEVIQKFSLKSFEGGTKILIVWRADKMNTEAANKLLKFLEEPPEKTLIFLTAESTGDILPTILSRCQVTDIPRIADEEMSNFMKAKLQVSDEVMKQIINQSEGNWNIALKLLSNNQTSSEFEELFVQWVRDAFQVKKKPEFLRSIINWSRDVASWNREKQKKFLDYCAEMFRLAMMQNYGAENLVYTQISLGNFRWDKFSEHIHGANIEDILEEISEADYHLSRNANAKIVWTDLGIKLTRYIHRKL